MRPAKQSNEPSRTAKVQNDPEDSDDDRSSDSDFNIEKTAVEESDFSDDDEAPKANIPGDVLGKRKRKGGASASRKRTKGDDDDSDDEPTSAVKGKQGRQRAKGKVTFAELDSGDEVTITQGSRKSKRGGKVGIVIDEDEEGGDGGWVKTRSQRRLEVEDERPLATTDGATIDVDDVWARLAAMPVGRPPDEIEKEAPIQNEADFITIKRTTRFAGEVTTEEKRVHKNSAEAKLYLEEQEGQKKKATSDAQMEDIENIPAGTDDVSTAPALRRPLKRRSRFEANPTGEVKSLPPQLQLRWPRDKTVEMANADRSKYTGPKGLPAAKINTVDKSRQDWAGYVDKTGIAEELDKYGKSKSTYLGRQDFLNRAENHIEAERRDARQKI
jgi:hypothetical protein